MRITILAVGSRGDAQPYTALGLGLQRAGHEVKIATHEVFREMVTERGLEFGLIRLNPQEMLKQEAGQAWLEAGKNPVRFIRHMARAFAPLLHEMLTDCLHACEGSDVVLVSPLAIAALPAVEKVGARAMLVSLWSNLPTHDYPSLYAPTLPFGGPIAEVYNRATYDLAALPKRLFGRPIWQALDRWQREVLKVDSDIRRPAAPPHALGRMANAGRLQPQRVSPARRTGPQWVHVTGYWFLDAEPAWQPPTALVDFLQAGPAPVYIGFGSMAGPQPAAARRDCRESAGAERPAWDPADRMGRAAAERPAGQRAGRRFCAPRLAVPTDGGSGPPRRRRHHGGRAARRKTDRDRTVLWRPTLLGPARGGTGRGS